MHLLPASAACTVDVVLPRMAFRLLSECPLPTEDGDVTLRIYGDGTCSPWPVCVYGEVHGKSGLSVRLHDACMTSEVLASVKCDCAKQLKLAQRQLAASGGVLVCARVYTRWHERAHGGMGRLQIHRR